MGVLLASMKSLYLFFYGWGFCLHSVGNGGGIILKAFIGGVSFFEMRVRGAGRSGIILRRNLFRLLFYYDLFFVDFWIFFSFGEVPLFLVFIGSHSLFLCF